MIVNYSFFLILKYLISVPTSEIRAHGSWQQEWRDEELPFCLFYKVAYTCSFVCTVSTFLYFKCLILLFIMFSIKTF